MKRRRIIILVGMSVLFMLSQASVFAAPVLDVSKNEIEPAATDRYVATTGNDNPANDCSSAGNPCLTVAYATSKAVDGDTILIASGTYNNTSVVCAKSLIYSGSGMDTTILDGGDSARVFEFSGATKTVTVRDLTIQNGSANFGPGIFNVSDFYMYRVTVTENIATAFAGGILLANGTADIQDSVISHNQAFNTTGSGTGGGVYIDSPEDVEITETSINNNTSKGYGGGIHAQGGANLTITNVTISENTAANNGGIRNDASTNLTLLNSTIAYNHLSSGGSNGGLYNDDATATVKNTIIANNDDTDCAYGGSSVWTSNGNNISSDSSCLFGLPSDQTSTDPKLLALADNGDYSLTHALGVSSPAVDTGNNTGCPGTDGRNVIRPADGDGDGTSICDIGAYERKTLQKKSFRSKGKYDGRITESQEASSVGKWKDSTTNSFYVGDDDKDRQYRSILHFSTKHLPDDAVVTAAKMKIKLKSVTGTDPFTTHGKLKIDLQVGAFSGNNGLQATDFEASASKKNAATVKNTPSAGWYTGKVPPQNLKYFNTTGPTQVRLRFATDDNDDMSMDISRFYSGDYFVIGDRPKLILKYYEK